MALNVIEALRSAAAMLAPRPAAWLALGHSLPPLAAQAGSSDDSGSGSSSLEPCEPRAACEALVMECFSDADCAALLNSPNMDFDACMANALCNAAMSCDPGPCTVVPDLVSAATMLFTRSPDNLIPFATVVAVAVSYCVLVWVARKQTQKELEALLMRRGEPRASAYEKQERDRKQMNSMNSAESWPERAGELLALAPEPEQLEYPEQPEPEPEPQPRPEPEPEPEPRPEPEPEPEPRPEPEPEPERRPEPEPSSRSRSRSRSQQLGPSSWAEHVTGPGAR